MKQFFRFLKSTPGNLASVVVGQVAGVIAIAYGIADIYEFDPWWTSIVWFGGSLIVMWLSWYRVYRIYKRIR